MSHVEQMNEIKAKNAEGSTSNPEVNMVQIEELQQQTARPEEEERILVKTVTRSMAKREKGKIQWDEQEEARRRTMEMLIEARRCQEQAHIAIPTEKASFDGLEISTKQQSSKKLKASYFPTNIDMWPKLAFMKEFKTLTKPNTPIELEILIKSHIPTNLEIMKESSIPIELEIPKESSILIELETPKKINIPINFENPKEPNILIELEIPKKINISINFVNPKEHNISIELDILKKINILINLENLKQPNIMIDLETPSKPNIPIKLEIHNKSKTPVDITIPKKHNIPVGFETSTSYRNSTQTKEIAEAKLFDKTKPIVEDQKAEASKDARSGAVKGDNTYGSRIRGDQQGISLTLFHEIIRDLKAAGDELASMQEGVRSKDSESGEDMDNIIYKVTMRECVARIMELQQQRE